MTNPPNRLAQARLLITRYEKIIPAHILKPFIQAVAHNDLPPARLEGETSKDMLILYGPAFWDDSPQFMSYGRALDNVKYYLACRCARTWGEFRLALPEHYRDQLASFVAGSVESADFDSFLDRRMLEDPKITWHKAWREFKSLSPANERPPLDGDPFHSDYWQQLEFDFHLGPPDNQVDMSGTMPSSIIRKYGTQSDGIWDGPYLSFPVDKTEEIIAELERLGYTVVRDPLLMDAANGEIEHPQKIRRRVLADRYMGRLLDELYPGPEKTINDDTEQEEMW